MGSMLSRLPDLAAWHTVLPYFALAAGLLGRPLLKNLPAIWAILNVDKCNRYRVCLEVMRLRRPDAPQLPSYLADDTEP